MLVERIDIAGFRGIHQLSLMLDQSTILIGENAWGKSSLLDALTLLLDANNPLYQLTHNDFYLINEHNNERVNVLRILFTFKESQNGQSYSPRYQNLNPLWIKNNNQLARIYYCIEGRCDAQGNVDTRRSFLNGQNNTLPLTEVNELVKEIIRLHPVLRLSHIKHIEQIESDKLDPILPANLSELLLHLNSDIKGFAKIDLNGSVQAMRSLLANYLAGHGCRREIHNNSASKTVDWRSLESLNRAIGDPKNKEVKPLLLKVFSGLLPIESPNTISQDAVPLLLVEEPESRLHPIMMSVAWGLLNQLPLQKITTTNSGELLSLVPLEQVCRLVRNNNSITSYQLGSQRLTAEEGRQIAFHIRFNRASSLFLRCWLLVEGETEVWLLNELARQCGYHFETEGIKIVEFAQSGIKPLIKFADLMGIEWHVLVDGDDAGRKYADIARSLIYANNNDSDSDDVQDRITVLHAPDLEHFMYRSGFETVYQRVAALPERAHLSVRRIIHKAIQRSSKPDLAIEVAEQADKWGVNSIPPLLRRMLSKVLWLARGKAD